MGWGQSKIYIRPTMEGLVQEWLSTRVSGKVLEPLIGSLQCCMSI